MYPDRPHLYPYDPSRDYNHCRRCLREWPTERINADVLCPDCTKTAAVQAAIYANVLVRCPSCGKLEGRRYTWDDHTCYDCRSPF